MINFFQRHKQKCKKCKKEFKKAQLSEGICQECQKLGIPAKSTWQRCTHCSIFFPALQLSDTLCPACQKLFQKAEKSDFYPPIYEPYGKGYPHVPIQPLSDWVDLGCQQPKRHENREKCICCQKSFFEWQLSHGLCPNCQNIPQAQCAHCGKWFFESELSNGFCCKCKFKSWRNRRICDRCHKLVFQSELSNGLCLKCQSQDLKKQAICVGCHEWFLMSELRNGLCFKCQLKGL
ncbi:MAG: hypothetical protein RMX68_019170 [Aulosira sp. ZfuVER01]|nr:hypothetical protein [Aulosira sp. ZfuVER01]MDZ8002809.1 hypothetical protein [Aulosira sp. DedVER01a]MDZ8054373.1 hypothetical protein [Aulosira sp. ZfuCHP01]